VIEVVELGHDYGRKRALDGVSLSVRAGEVVGLIGPNGAGKTTLMRAIVTLLRPSRGRVSVGGRDTRGEGAEVRRLVGYLPERAPLYTDLRVWEHLDLFAEIAGHALDERNRRIQAALAQAGIEDRRDALTRELSKGLGQRLALQAALLHDPRALVLDEPTDGLDPESRASVLAEVRRLADQGSAVLLSSHVLDEVEQIADRSVILVDGRVAESQAREGRYFSLRVRGDHARARELLAARDDVEEIIVEGESLLVRLASGVPDAADAAGALVAAGFFLVELREEKESLRERFHRVVKEERAQ
jgi:ABC-2 type transport system ATP-binding protein